MVSGLTYSSDFPAVRELTSQPTPQRRRIIALFNPTITSLIDSTYRKVPRHGFQAGARLYPTPTDIFVTGRTGGTTFPPLQAFPNDTAEVWRLRLITRFTAGGWLSGNHQPVQRRRGASGGSQTVSITAPSGCPWFAYSQSAAISITSAASGSGPGSVTFAVQANTGAARPRSLPSLGCGVPRWSKPAAAVARSRSAPPMHPSASRAAAGFTVSPTSRAVPGRSPTICPG